jgi:hypothetical protein
MSLVVCLNCGQSRHAQRDGDHHVVTGDCCARCGYVGWVDAPERPTAARRLRHRPLIRRRLLTLS